MLFNPDGCCLYSGFQDSLRVYGWEPERCFDVVLVNWGKVADLSICNNQLVSHCSWGGGKVAVKHEIKSSCLCAGLLTFKLISDKWPGLATCPAREILCAFAFSSTMLTFFSLWLLEERAGAWFDQYLETEIGKSFIIAFHKTLAAWNWKSQSTELRNSQAQLLRVSPSCLLSKRLVHTLFPGELPWPFAFADRRFLCTKHSLFLCCGSQPSHKVGFCSSWADEGWWASCAAYPYGVLPSPHLWQALNQLQQATKVRESAGLLNFKILSLYARNLVLSLSLTDSVWLALTASLFFHSRVKHNSESERRSPSSEDDRDEKESRAEIQNQEDYKEIFQPKNAICQYQGLLCFWVFGLGL